jgi:hypothetical protein
MSFGMSIGLDDLDIYTREEELCDELRQHVFVRDGGMQVLSHPLVQDVPFFDNGRCARQNMMLAHKKQALREAEEQRNWERYVFLHERPYRFDALFELVLDCALAGEDIYWPLVSDVWTDSENIWQNFDDWLSVWNTDAPGRRAAMDEQDLAFYNSLPEDITLYRGWNGLGTPNGMSWTTDEARGVFFAKRYALGGAVGYLSIGKAKKKDVFAALVGRGESEIVIDPDNVEITHHGEIT